MTLGNLSRKRIGILEARMASELSKMLQKYGAETISAPAVRETQIDCSPEVAELIKRISDNDIQIVVMQTGVGVRSLFKEATQINKADELRAGLETLTYVARGPKPVAALRREGLTNPVTIKSPYTTAELIEALMKLNLANSNVAVLHYGERNHLLAKTLSSACQELYELCLYEWMWPEDIRPVENLIAEVLARNIDALVFTSQVQVRHLFQIAEKTDQHRALKSAMNNALVAAVGPTTANALDSYDVTVDVMPKHPKMGHMVKELAYRLSMIPTV